MSKDHVVAEIFLCFYDVLDLFEEGLNLVHYFVIVLLGKMEGCLRLSLKTLGLLDVHGELLQKDFDLDLAFHFGCQGANGPFACFSDIEALTG